MLLKLVPPPATILFKRPLATLAVLVYGLCTVGVNWEGAINVGINSTNSALQFGLELELVLLSVETNLSRLGNVSLYYIRTRTMGEIISLRPRYLSEDMGRVVITRYCQVLVSVGRPMRCLLDVDESVESLYHPIRYPAIQLMLVVCDDAHLARPDAGSRYLPCVL